MPGKILASSLATLLLLALGLLLPAPTAHSAEIRSGRSIVVPEQQFVNDDLYVATTDFLHDGNITGDLLVVTDGFTANGRITGNVMVLARDVTLNNFVGGSVRVIGGNVTINGQVARDLVALGGDVTIGPEGNIRRDVVAAISNFTLEGSVNRHVSGRMGSMFLNGRVGGNTDISVDELRVGPAAATSGYVMYTSEQEADVNPEAQIAGDFNRVEPDPEERHSPTMMRIRILIGLFALGLLLIFLTPHLSRSSRLAIIRSPWASLGLGVLMIVLVPVAAAIVLTLGFFIGGWWIGSFILALYVIALVVALIVSASAAGSKIVRLAGPTTIHPVLLLLIGLLLLFVLSYIPVLGPLAVLLAVWLGVGGLVLGGWRLRKAPLSEGPGNGGASVEREEAARPAIVEEGEATTEGEPAPSEEEETPEG